jgi:hypothetical protein
MESGFEPLPVRLQGRWPLRSSRRGVSQFRSVLARTVRRIGYVRPLGGLQAQLDTVVAMLATVFRIAGTAILLIFSPLNSWRHAATLGSAPAHRSPPSPRLRAISARNLPQYNRYVRAVNGPKSLHPPSRAPGGRPGSNIIPAAHTPIGDCRTRASRVVLRCPFKSGWLASLPSFAGRRRGNDDHRGRRARHAARSH